MRETSANEPLRTHRKLSDDIETGEPACPGKSMVGTYLRAMRCPVYRRRESHPGFRTELENLAGDGKGKSTSGSTVRLKVPRRQPGADCSVVAEKRGNSRGAKGAGHRRRGRQVNRKREEPTGLGGRRQPSLGGTSRMNREVHVRICERLGVQFPGATRQPAPERERKTTWKEFLCRHRDVMVAADFFTIEAWTRRGLTGFLVLFLIDLSSRKVQIAGVTRDANVLWMSQVGRNLSDAAEGFLIGKRYLIHDRDPLFTEEFSKIFQASGVKIGEVTTVSLRAFGPRNFMKLLSCSFSVSAYSLTLAFSTAFYDVIPFNFNVRYSGFSGVKDFYQAANFAFPDFDITVWGEYDMPGCSVREVTITGTHKG